MRKKLKSWKIQETKPEPLNRLCGPFAIFRPGVKKNLTVDHKTITKLELNQALCQFYATVKNRKGEPMVSAVLLV